jgi:hypothetical protein
MTRMRSIHYIFSSFLDERGVKSMLDWLPAAKEKTAEELRGKRPLLPALRELMPEGTVQVGQFVSLFLIC